MVTDLWAPQAWDGTCQILHLPPRRSKGEVPAVNSLSSARWAC